VKKCSKCQETKPFADFGKDSRSKSGLRGHCRTCNAQYAYSWVAKNPDRAKARSKAHYEANKQLYIDRATNWSKNNPDKMQQIRAKTRLKHKDKHAYLIKQWGINNKELKRSYLQKRRALQKQNGVFAVTKKELIKLYNNPCFYCGSREKITIDHIIPIIKGGTHGVGNLTSACKACNSSKNDDFLTVWKKRKTNIGRLQNGN
jgi:5-methylcytosine-specific restriction endonuclease McrA